MRRVPLLRRVLLAVAVGIIPVAAMSGVGLYLLVRQQHAQALSAGRDLARALATGGDAELRSSITVLQALAASRALDAGDLRAFRADAQRVLGAEPRWHAVTVTDPSGRRLTDTRFESAPPPPIVDAASFAAVARTRKPVVGNLTRGIDGRMNFPVRVPVVRDGELRYILSAIVDPAQIVEVVQRQRVPADWVISIFDASNRRVARSDRKSTRLNSS